VGPYVVGRFVVGTFLGLKTFCRSTENYGGLFLQCVNKDYDNTIIVYTRYAQHKEYVVMVLYSKA
jgi:hypothetical protein